MLCCDGRVPSIPATLLRWSRTPSADVVLAVALFGLGVLLHLSGAVRPMLPMAHPPVALSLLLLGLACLMQTQRRRMAGLTLAVVFVVFLVSGLVGFSVPVLLVLMDGLFVATLYTSERVSRRVVRINLTVVLLGVLASLVLIPDLRAAAQAALGIVSVFLVPMWWALQVRHHQRAAEDERERGRQQARLAELDRRAAIGEERGRMARDLHDVISGHVSAIAIQSEAVLQLADGSDPQPDPQTVRRVLRSVRENSVAALTEMRTMIELLRAGDGTEQDGLAAARRLRDLDQLVDSARAGGLTVRVDERPGDDLPAAVDLAAYRIVQEALTNVAKHASGADTSIALTRQDGALVVQVRNALPGPVADHGAGTGLLSMAERAQAVGGSLDAGRHEDGWRVRAVLPTEAARS